jgi:hypothetical protein
MAVSEQHGAIARKSLFANELLRPDVKCESSAKRSYHGQYGMSAPYFLHLWTRACGVSRLSQPFKHCDDDDITPYATWKAGLPRNQPCQVYKNAQGRAKQKAYRGQTKQNHILLKRVEYNAYPAKQWKSIMSMLMGETQLLCTGAREPGCEQTRKDDEGQLYPPLLGLADRAWQNHARPTRRR